MSEKKCPQCGAFVKFEPGTAQLKCPYCASEFAIEQKAAPIEEWDYEKFLSRMEEDSETEEAAVIKCSGCGSEITLGEHVTADTCPYCASSLIVDKKVVKKAIKPRYLLPFAATAKETRDLFQQWIGSLWFAPGSLKKLARADSGITGIYAPYWTYDSDTRSAYTGQRGDYYFEPVTVTVMRDGKEVAETQMVQKIRWTPASGEVRLRFDDVLVVGSRSLPFEYAQALEPWDLGNLVPHDERYLYGFMSESYQIGPREGFDGAKQIMDGEIAKAIMTDIGGDVQQIDSVNSRYNRVKFKHILLPIWMNSYRYSGQLYRFMVNARTGEIQGERPWSWIKIGLAVAAAALIAYLYVLVSSGRF
jgi:DNA-directed RNA polymerase subunit RPC12/RpoP